MQSQATAQTRTPQATPHGQRAPRIPADPTGAPAAGTRPQAPQAPRSVRWAAGLASVFVTVTLFSTVVDTFQGAPVDGPWALTLDSTVRG